MNTIKHELADGRSVVIGFRFPPARWYGQVWGISQENDKPEWDSEVADVFPPTWEKIREELKAQGIELPKLFWGSVDAIRDDFESPPDSGGEWKQRRDNDLARHNRDRASK